MAIISDISIFLRQRYRSNIKALPLSQPQRGGCLEVLCVPTLLLFYFLLLPLLFSAQKPPQKINEQVEGRGYIEEDQDRKKIIPHPRPPGAAAADQEGEGKGDPRQNETRPGPLQPAEEELQNQREDKEDGEENFNRQKCQWNQKHSFFPFHEQEVLGTPLAFNHSSSRRPPIH